VQLETIGNRFGWFIAAAVVGIVGLFVALYRSKRRLHSSESPPRTILDYLLLWPLVLDQPARRDRVATGGQMFTTGEKIGAGVFVAILVVGFIFF
jgi:hypothetical protein